MDLNLKDQDFWYGLHGQVPGLLDWDMGNELQQRCTTDQCSGTERTLSKYKLQLTTPPTMPQEKKSNPDDDGPPTEPNLWMWVNPNIVCPLNQTPAPNSDSRKELPVLLPTNDEESDDSEAHKMVESLSASASEQLSDSDDKEEAKDAAYYEREDSLSETVYEARASWPRPPLNYSHIISVALINNSSSGLSVQQITDFIQLHFPYFRTAAKTWKTTIRYNLRSQICFEKVPPAHEQELEGKTPCLWKLSEEGHRFFGEDIRLLAFSRKDAIRQSMLQPEMMELFFQI